MNDKLVLFVAGYDGVISGYEVNTTTGGECKRVSHDLLFNMTVTTGIETTPVSNLSQRGTGKCVKQKLIGHPSFISLFSDKFQGDYPPNVFKNEDKTPSKSSE